MNNKLSMFLAGLALFLSPGLVMAQSAPLAVTVNGRVLINVDQRGEAWYVWPKSVQRYYLANGQITLGVMQKTGQKTTNTDLAKIKIGIIKDSRLPDADIDGIWDGQETALGMNPNSGDSDNDGYADGTEIANNYSPLGAGKMITDDNFAKSKAGYILLQYQNHGEAWYVWPADNKRYYLGTGEQAFIVLTRLGLGITNSDLLKVPIAADSGTPTVITTESVDILAGEYLIYLKNDRILIGRNKNLAITFTNKGNQPHRLIITGLDVLTEQLHPGQKQTILIPAGYLHSGNYTVEELTETDRSKGMLFNFTIQII
ncbi:MAG: hypothetical protein Q8P32_01825 [Candidatus Komeilibacteria bacterium]|nr:hypothetical protein [Candidatus Komeilibacteria bacterium]